MWEIREIEEIRETENLFPLPYTFIPLSSLQPKGVDMDNIIKIYPQPQWIYSDK